MFYQNTIRKSISCAGIGLHSGKKVNITLKPSEVNSGVTFKRVDISSDAIVKASLENMVNTNYATSLRKGDIEIKTVEHLLAAFAGLGIDNAVVELDSSEVPIMDGSAAPFIYLLHEAGVVAQEKPKEFIKINRTIKVTDGDKYIKVSPYDRYKISYGINFQHHLLKDQNTSFVYSEEEFVRKISRSRTFGFLKEVEALRKNGLAKGGSLDNAVVIGEYRILNGGLRFEDEFVCHKVMDAMGDLFLLGKPIIGHVEAYKAGHGLHAKLGQAILRNKQKYSLISGTSYFRKKKFTDLYQAKPPISLFHRKVASV